MACGATRSLNETGKTAKKPFFICVENGNKCDFWQIKALTKEAKKREVIYAYVVEAEGGPKLKLYLYQRASQGKRPCRWDTTKSITTCEKFKGAGTAEGAAIVFTAGYPKYLHKVRVRVVTLKATKFEWGLKGR